MPRNIKKFIHSKTIKIFLIYKIFVKNIYKILKTNHLGIILQHRHAYTKTRR